MAHARNQAARTQQLNPNRLRCPADTGKPLTCPPARKERSAHPCPCDLYLATRLLNRAPARMPARPPPPGGGLDARYEQLRHAALHARAQAFPPGLGVLTGKGVTAWQQALASLAVPQPAPPGTAPAHLPALPAPVAAELISAPAAVALAGTVPGPPR